MTEATDKLECVTGGRHVTFLNPHIFHFPHPSVIDTELDIWYLKSDNEVNQNAEELDSSLPFCLLGFQSWFGEEIVSLGC